MNCRPHQRPLLLPTTLLAAACALAACATSGPTPAPESRRTASSRSATSAATAPASAAGDTTSAAAEPSAEGSASASGAASAPGAASSAAASSSAQGATSAASSASASTTASASAPAPAETVMGKEQGSGQYGAWLQSSGRYTAGQPGAVTVVLTAKGDFHCNDKYPYKLKLDPPQEGVSYPESTVRGMVIGEKRSTMSVPFVASKPGPVTISGSFYFSVCTESSCKIDNVPLAVTVHVD